MKFILNSLSYIFICVVFSSIYNIAHCDESNHPDTDVTSDYYKTIYREDYFNKLKVNISEIKCRAHNDQLPFNLVQPAQKWITQDKTQT